MNAASLKASNIKRIAKDIKNGILTTEWTVAELLDYEAQENEFELSLESIKIIISEIKNRWGFLIKGKIGTIEKMLRKAYDQKIADGFKDIIADITIAKNNGTLLEVAHSYGIETLNAFIASASDFSEPSKISYYEILTDAYKQIMIESISAIEDIYEESMDPDSDHNLRGISISYLMQIYMELIDNPLAKEAIPMARRERALHRLIVLHNRVINLAQKDLNELLDAEQKGCLEETMTKFSDKELSNMMEAISKMTKTQEYPEYRRILLMISSKKRDDRSMLLKHADSHN